MMCACHLVLIEEGRLPNNSKKPDDVRMSRGAY